MENLGKMMDQGVENLANMEIEEISEEEGDWNFSEIFKSVMNGQSDDEGSREGDSS